MTNTRRFLPGLLSLISVLATFSATSARAEPKGQLFITKDRLLEAGQLGHASTARGREIHMVWPVEEHGNDTTTWTVNYAALFARPLGDYEAELKFWDVTKGPARFVTSEDQFTRQKDTRAMTGQLKLTSPEFERNHRYLVRLESRHAVLCEVTFWLRGTPARYDGHVDFNDEETVK
ncbi:MAG TPA: hypothetical protein VK989_04530 [Polyangia bacterium]|nr:hypothetical protein [Polyangia bacterium]